MRDIYTTDLAWRDKLDDGPCVPINKRPGEIKGQTVSYLDARYPQKCSTMGSAGQYMCATNKDDLINMMIERMKAEIEFEGDDPPSRQRIKNLEKGIENE
jgi:hypothetical protein